MTFMRKILDVFKMESTKERECSNAVNDHLEVLYHDRFDEEYRKVDAYKEIYFTSNKFHIPEVQICVAILLDGSKKGSVIREHNEYSLYFEGRYGIANISRLHQWLYEQGYLRSAFLPEALSLYKIPELKTILESLGLKKSGNKDNLIDRIINTIDDKEKEEILNQCEHLFVTEKGLTFLEENSDYVMYHRKSYGVPFEEFNKHRILQGRKRKFYDTIFQSLNEQAYTYQVKQYYSKLGMIYYNLSEVCYDEGRYDISLQYTLYRLYFSTNLASKTYLFDVDLVKYDGIENCKNCIISADIYNQLMLNRIDELKQFFREQMLDVVYTPEILPYCLFGKYDMLEVIQDLYDGILNVENYTNYIRMNYENYIKNFI